VEHHHLDVDVAVGSRAHGKTKPDPTIFEAALLALEVEPQRAAMVGDSIEDDIEGARALGMRALLLDRAGRFPDFEPRLPDLFALPAALGLVRN
jgi:FMN phosphatase YigB (HAD superfamily)